jgi:RNA polymerase sigma-70 factor (ECF subfamily)
MQQLDESKEEGDTAVPVIEQSLNPEQEASKVELGRLLEEALLELPEQYRSVLMLRHVEEMSTAETAEVLSLSEENVKVRLHRGRALMRRNLIERMGSQAKEAFPFMGTRCDRVTAAVLRRIVTAA